MQACAGSHARELFARHMRIREANPLRPAFWAAERASKKFLKKLVDFFFGLCRIKGVSKGAGVTKHAPSGSKRERPKMAMYIVTFWTSVDIGDGMCYEFQEKMVLMECELEEINDLDVESVKLLD